MKSYTLAIIFFLTPYFSFSEDTTTIDGLEKVLEATVSKEKKIDILNELAEVSLNIDNEASLVYAEEALGLSMRLDNKKGMSRAYLSIASCYFHQTKYLICLDYLFKKMSIDEDMHDDKGIAIASNIIGLVYYNQGNYDQALSYYEKALKIFEQLGIKDRISDVYTNLGNLYTSRKDYDKALDFFQKSIVYDERSNNSKISIVYNNMGCVYFEGLQDTVGINHLYKALELSNKESDSTVIALVHNSIGDFYLWQKKYDKAYSHLMIAYGIAIRHKLLIRQKDIACSLSELYFIRKEHKKAYEYHLLYKQFSDSLFNEQNSRVLTQLEMQYEFDKQQKEQAIELLEKDKKIKIQRLEIVLSIIVFLFVAVYIFIWFKNKTRQNNFKLENLKLEQKLLKEELEFKNKEIATKVMNLINKNELILSIVDQLQHVKLRFKKENQNVIDEVIGKLQANVNKEIWKEFEYRFKQVHSDFYKNLSNTFPLLTSNDLKLCAFLRLNMSTKDISAITHQPANSIEVARTRLRKKLELSNTDISLVTYLSQF